MNCTFCTKKLGVNCLEGGYCSVLCEARAEHEDRLRENERMSIHLCELDDGGFTVELKMRSNGEFSEMTNTFDSFPAALRGIATLCVTSADKIEAPK